MHTPTGRFTTLVDRDAHKETDHGSIGDDAQDTVEAGHTGSGAVARDPIRSAERDSGAMPPGPFR
jgi:hypothetical protein